MFLLLAALVGGCSDDNSNAPPPGEPHPADFVLLHADQAQADLASCQVCHGVDFRGSGEAVSCFSCHAFNDAPPFTIHPTDWTDPFVDHRAFASANGFSTCAVAACHGDQQPVPLGGTTGPSCATATFTNAAGQTRSCHEGGPGVAPHPVDGSYLSGAAHGPDAKADLTVCQNCHGQLGGPGTNPRFNDGINSAGGNGCENCHNDFTAHPSAGGRDGVPWYDVGVTHRDAGNLVAACGLCHGVALDGVGGVGPACTDCHTVDPVASPAGCVSCHNTPPNGGGLAGAVTPNRTGQHNRGGHTVFINDLPELTCARCHDGAGFGTANHFDQVRPADVSIPLLDPQDTINAVSDGTNTTCNGACHVPSINFTFTHNNSLWY